MQPHFTWNKDDAEPPPPSSVAIFTTRKMTSRSRLTTWRRSVILPAVVAALGAFTACDSQDTNPAIDDSAQATVILAQDPNHSERIETRLVVKAQSKDIATAKVDEIRRILSFPEARSTSAGMLLLPLANVTSDNLCHQRRAGKCRCGEWGTGNCCDDCDD